MGAALLTCLVLGGLAPGELERLFAQLGDPAREVRESAEARLVQEGPSGAELAVRMGRAEATVAEGLARVLTRRLDAGALEQLYAQAAGGDQERAERAAATLVRIAGPRRLPIDRRRSQSDRLFTRLACAVEAYLLDRLSALDSPPSLDRPQTYRALYACGSYAEKPLARWVGDPGLPVAMRAHALHAFVRLTGKPAAEPLLLKALASSDPVLRSQAAGLLLHYGSQRALLELAALLDRPANLRAALREAAIEATRRVRRITDRGAARLVRVVRTGGVLEASRAAAVLRALRPAAARRPMKDRLASLLRMERLHPGSGSGAAFFALEAGPLGEEFVRRFRRTNNPLLQAVAAPDTRTALGSLAPLLAPGKPLGSREWMRGRVVFSLLTRDHADWTRRAAFARSVLESDSPSLRLLGYRILQGAPEALRTLFARAIAAGLLDAGESARLAAAALTPAEAVLAGALYDGDPLAARVVAQIAPGRCDPQAPVAVRREVGRRWLEAVAGQNR